jgi:hypothetical protein
VHDHISQNWKIIVFEKYYFRRNSIKKNHPGLEVAEKNLFLKGK